jgi:hypothetical protein
LASNSIPIASSCFGAAAATVWNSNAPLRSCMPPTQVPSSAVAAGAKLRADTSVQPRRMLHRPNKSAAASAAASGTARIGAAARAPPFAFARSFFGIVGALGRGAVLRAHTPASPRGTDSTGPRSSVFVTRR